MEISQKILVKEPAFRYGQGFFTTTRVKQFTPLYLPLHIRRLNNSLRDFKMPGVDEENLLQLAGSWPRKNQLPEGFLRIMVWAAGEQVHFHLDGGVLDASPRGMKLCLSSIKRHSSEPLLRYKSFNYWNNQLAYQQALQNGYDEAVLCNENDEITECSRNNIFWIKHEALFTPQLECGLLPGIARSIIISIAEEQGITLVQGRFGQEALEAAEAMFLSNSVHGIREVLALHDKCYQSSAILHRLQLLYAQKESETRTA